MNFKINNSGQLTVIGLLLMFLTLLVMAALMPTMLASIATLAANLTTNGYYTEAVLVKFIPLFFLVVFLATIAMYGGPQVR